MVQNLSKRSKFSTNKRQKEIMNVTDLCGIDGTGSRALCVKAFGEEIMKLSFEDKPDYSKLKFLLIKELLDLGSVPDKAYDWINFVNNSWINQNIDQIVEQPPNPFDYQQQGQDFEVISDESINSLFLGNKFIDE